MNNESIYKVYTCFNAHLKDIEFTFKPLNCQDALFQSGLATSKCISHSVDVLACIHFTLYRLHASELDLRWIWHRKYLLYALLIYSLIMQPNTPRPIGNIANSQPKGSLGCLDLFWRDDTNVSTMQHKYFVVTRTASMTEALVPRYRPSGVMVPTCQGSDKSKIFLPFFAPFHSQPKPSSLIY